MLTPTERRRVQAGLRRAVRRRGVYRFPWAADAQLKDVYALTAAGWRGLFQVSPTDDRAVFWLDGEWGVLVAQVDRLMADRWTTGRFVLRRDLPDGALAELNHFYKDAGWRFRRNAFGWVNADQVELVCPPGPLGAG